MRFHRKPPATFAICEHRDPSAARERRAGRRVCLEPHDLVLSKPASGGASPEHLDERHENLPPFGLRQQASEWSRPARRRPRSPGARHATGPRLRRRRGWLPTPRSQSPRRRRAPGRGWSRCRPACAPRRRRGPCGPASPPAPGDRRRPARSSAGAGLRPDPEFRSGSRPGVASLNRRCGSSGRLAARTRSHPPSRASQPGLLEDRTCGLHRRA
jgi:hypothetical protein